jgi:hypothetical protein
MRDLIDLVEGSVKERIMCWIAADGGQINVDATHEYTAGMELDIEPDDGDSGSYRASEAAYTAGWIRVSAEGSEFGADWNHTTSAALLSLRKMVDKLPEFETYYFASVDVLTKKRAMGYLMKLSRS